MTGWEKAFNYYAVLNVWATATDAQIKEAYRNACRDAHPDRGGSADVFAEIAEAYHAIKNVDLRVDLAEKFAFVGDLCTSCSGTGAQRKTISFTEAAFSQCSPCRGAGYTRRVR